MGPGGQRYRPPALRALASGEMPTDSTPPSLVEGSTLPPSNYGPGFRRARAGTLPSNVHLAAQRFAAASNTLSSTAGGSTDSFADQLQQNMAPPQPQPTSRPHSQSIAGMAGQSGRPALRHAQSVAAPTASERNSRLRSGSLTLPSAQLANNNDRLSSAFGPGIFNSSGWIGAGQGQGNGLSTIDSYNSMDNDDFDPHAPMHHTLDYLGLDDGHRTATLSELRAQTQAAITNNIPARMRASTVSNMYPRIRGAGSLLPTPAAGDDDDMSLYEQYAQTTEPQQQSYGRPRAESHAALLGGGGGGGVGEGYYPSGSSRYQQDNLLAPSQPTNNRPRAISVGILDDPSQRTLQHRSSAGDSLSNAYLNANDYNNVQPSYGASQQVNNLGGILKSESKMSNARTTVHFPQEDVDTSRVNPYLMAPSQQGRSISPTKVADNSSSQIQTPTRSLWIGNLDSGVTSEQLIHVFAPYGAIESLRLLPEKVCFTLLFGPCLDTDVVTQECGFVNFVDMADAIRAKEDVLNRLGGNIGMPNGQTVRIGFGKADSAPVAPAKGINVTSPGVNSPAPGASKGPGNAGLGGMESQLQSSPTRALWIGSIPSTTTPAAILSVFSPYGPIESARVLTHKNCGFINFERLDDAVRARKALNGRDILGSDVGAIRIGFAKVPVKNGQETANGEEAPNPVAVGVGELSVGATIHALRSVKGATTIPAEQQVLGGGVENYRSHLLLSMISSGQHSASFIMDGMTKQQARAPSVTEQQMIMKELSGGSPDAEADILTLAGRSFPYCRMILAY
jgi:protein JSN1